MLQLLIFSSMNVVCNTSTALFHESYLLFNFQILHFLYRVDLKGLEDTLYIGHLHVLGAWPSLRAQDSPGAVSHCLVEFLTWLTEFLPQTGPNSKTLIRQRTTIWVRIAKQILLIRDCKQGKFLLTTSDRKLLNCFPTIVSTQHVGELII